MKGHTPRDDAVGRPPLARVRRLPSAAPWLALGALVVTLTLAYAIKAVCVGGQPAFWGDTRYCHSDAWLLRSFRYSDVSILWSLRGFDVDAVPYAPPPGDYPTDYTFEYPPGLTFPAWLIALVTSSRAAFFNVHALTFAIAALATTAALTNALRALGRSPWRLLGFALSPGLVLFAMHNWDVWAVALTALGLAAASRGRPKWAGFWFGLGAATKWWPGLLVVTLLAGPWAPRDETGHPLRRLRTRAQPLLVAAAVWVTVQLPAMLIGVRGWAGATLFHLRRPPNPDSTGAVVAAVGSWLLPGPFWEETFTVFTTVVSLGVLMGGVLLVVSRLARHRLDPGDAALALVGLFLLTGKVFSPQFVLWLLPVAVLARVTWWPMAAVELTNAAVWLLYYAPWVVHQSDGSPLLTADQAASVPRSFAVAWLVLAALRYGAQPGHSRP
ncbi:MAG: glycosyltransferase 87 family protein [Actinomycetota bacterium]|nr:glycosyltransferase 87 family protein [Actinomycetota bacterium]